MGPRQASRYNLYIFLLLISISIIGLKYGWTCENKNCKNHHHPSEISQQLVNGVVAELKKSFIFESARKKNEIIIMDKLLLHINLATVACGNLEFLRVMLKSAILFSQNVILHLIIFTDPETHQDLVNSLIELKKNAESIRLNFTYEIHLTWFPQDPIIDWKEMHLKCTNQRLFFPSLLTHIDSLIYTDTDTFFIGNLSHLWTEFDQMDERQLIAMAPNAEDPRPSMYNPDVGFPYVEPGGINAGVMLMNLTRMRQFEFEQKAVHTYRQYKDKISYADQDILNILFHEHPSKIYVLSCIYNFYWIHCPQEKVNGTELCTGQNFDMVSNRRNPAPCFCHEVTTKGLHVIHGNDRSFEDPKNSSIFPWSFDIMKMYNLREPVGNLIQRFQDGFGAVQNSCFHLDAHLMTKSAQDYFQNLGLI